jgi:hypothetical protein
MDELDAMRSTFHDHGDMASLDELAKVMRNHETERVKRDHEQTIEENQPSQEENNHVDKRARHDLEQKDDEYERLKEELKASKEELKASKEELKASKEESRVWKQKYEEAKEENKGLKKDNNHYKLNCSIAGLWENDDQQRFKIEKYGGTLSTPHADTTRKSASAVVADFSLLTATLDAKTLKRQSKLLAAFQQVDDDGNRVNPYANDADVQGYVHDALIDAVRILNDRLGKGRLLTARHESGIFSNRPDHLVVDIGPWHTPIFVVEAKQPVDNIDNNDKVWGQIYDYHGMMRVVGHSNPFVVLSTFEKSWVTWDKHNKTCARIATTTDVEDRFHETIQQLKKHFSPHPSSETPSTCKLEAPTCQDRSQATTSQKRDETMRELERSEPYPSNQLVKLFVNAILCSLCNFQGSASTVRNNLGYQLMHKAVLTLEPEAYKFETISLWVVPSTFEESSNFDKHMTEEFHILDLLGSGRTSKVFRAVTTKGHECVLKMYVRKFDESENYMPLAKEQFASEARQHTETEQQMYKLIYGMNIPIIELFNHMCLVLPYFRPVQKDECDSAVGELDSLLREKFRVTTRATGTTYYKFEEDDQRWRHCGYMDVNGEKSLFVYDLANLDTCDNESDHDEYIEQHKTRLRSRISSPAS